MPAGFGHSMGRNLAIGDSLSEDGEMLAARTLA